MAQTTVTRDGRWRLVPALGLAAVLTSAGFADEPKPDGGKPPQKAGEAKPEVLVGPPPELAALRKAVEDAARKGENVDEVRKHLDALEKALTGKAWAKPKAVEPEPEALPPLRPAPGIRPLPPVLRPEARAELIPLPGIVNQEDVRRAEELMRKAAELLRADPEKNREEANKLTREAHDLLARRFQGGLMVVPDVRVGGFRDGQRMNGRLGVVVEKPPAVLADQLGLPGGQGLVIAAVRPGTAAEKAGLKVNDVLVEFAGKPVSDNPTEFVRTVELTKAGEKVDAAVVRKGKKEAVKGIELPEAVRDGGRRPAVGGDAPAIRDPEAGPAKREGRANTTSLRVADGRFTLTAERNGVKYRIEGGAGEGGKAVPTKIEIADGDKKVEAAGLDKVPAEYRRPVELLLNGVRIGGERR